MYVNEQSRQYWQSPCYIFLYISVSKTVETKLVNLTPALFIKVFTEAKHDKGYRHVLLLYYIVRVQQLRTRNVEVPYLFLPFFLLKFVQRIFETDLQCSVHEIWIFLKIQVTLKKQSTFKTSINVITTFQKHKTQAFSFNNFDERLL